MVRDPGAGAGTDNSFFTNPWPSLILGLLMTAAAALWFLSSGHAAPALVFLGLLASGIAISIRPRSVLVLGLAAVLVVVPRVVRRIVISLLVIFHFGGIVTAVTNIPPNPWLSSMAWAYVYSPYLEFFLFSNAYHFYSPEPGPGTQIWFFVEFEDGNVQEYMLADRTESPLKLEYQRRISIAESLNQKSNMPPLTSELLKRRMAAGSVDGIIMHPEIPEVNQYRPTTPWHSKRLLESYARYAARNVPHPTGANKKVTGIKVYLAVHRLLVPQEVVEGLDPEQGWLFMPYFMGDFDAGGKLKDPNDPYLYWLIPILKEPVPRKAGFFQAGIGRRAGLDEEMASDFLEIHRKLKTWRFDNRVNIPDAAN